MERARHFLVRLSLVAMAVAGPGIAITAAPAGAVGTPDVYGFGDAAFHGSTGPLALAHEVVGMARTASGNGYYEVASDGGIFGFGDAAFYGSTGAMHLNSPVVGMATTPSGHGYWLVATDGGIFTFGDAAFFGSTGGLHLNSAVVGMAATPSGHGYWLVASDGGIFSFGDAHFYGSTGAVHLNRPIAGMAAAPGAAGYWLVARDGGIFAFGQAPFYGSMGHSNLGTKSIIGITATPSGLGYWMVANRPIPPATSPAGGGRTSFGTGTWLVNGDIAPGTYENSDSSAFCEWQRMRGFSNQAGDIISYRHTSSRQIVTIAASDAGFQSLGCGTWTIDNHPLTSSTTAPFRDGEYRIGRDVAPGVWASNSGDLGCFWVRLRGFGGTGSEVIEFQNIFADTYVHIEAGDLGFESEGCGTWTKIS